MAATDGGLAAYQGAPGAFSEEAAWRLVGYGRALLPCATLADVRDAVASGRAVDAVVPIENSLAGTVPYAYELIVRDGDDRDTALTVRAEARIRIDHMLIGARGATLDDIRTVHSHPVALNQCRRFLAARGLEAVPAFDTAGAVAAVVSGGDRSSAAIASRRAAELHGGDILAERIQDYVDNWTRFLHIVPEPPARIGRKAIASFRLTHEPGSLSVALAALARDGANLTKIESRPIADRPFEYAFVIELESAGPRDWSPVIAALAPVAVSPRLVAAYDVY